MHRTLGWKDLSANSLETFKKNPRSVIVFPHTSRWDTFIVYAYALDYPELRGKFWVAMYDLPVNRKFSVLYQGIFKVLWIPDKRNSTESSQNSSGKKMGFVQKVVQQLQNEKEFLLLISPEGGCERGPWKSGYYHIARELKADLGVLGFDFAQHQIKTPMTIRPNWETQQSLEVQTPNFLQTVEIPQDEYLENLSERFFDQIQELLQQAMGTIMPLNPELSWVPVTAVGLPMSIPTSTKILVLVVIFSIVLGIWLWKRK